MYEYHIATATTAKPLELPLAEPVEGKWYCGFYFDENHEEYVSGPLGEYCGNGEFYDGDDEQDMRYCDYLIQQR